MKRVLLSVLLLTGLSSAASGAGIEREFSITGYYSPLPDQSYYVTGSYEGDVRLNGQGTHGADGTAVFPGMIAAPYDYPYGTKICIDGWGCGSVHDRGGAIVNKGVRDVARHDRLDLWMGYGEVGLARALEIGLWHTKGTIYSAESSVELGVNFKAVAPIAKVVEVPAVEPFNENLSIGSLGDEVARLQEDLAELGYFTAEETGQYGGLTQAAVLEFQIENFVIEDATSAGAGVFGPKTREAFGESLKKHRLSVALRRRWDESHFDENLSRGARSEYVWILQEFLIQKEYLVHEPTGYFGKLTREALIAFQLDQGLIESAASAGAGNVGPKTRAVLNAYMAQRKVLIAAEKEAVIAFNQKQKRMQFLAGKPSPVQLAQR